jgi:acyl transferase domain-containing protein
MERPRIAFLLSGQGAFYPGMGQGLLTTQAVFRQTLLDCQDVLRAELDVPLLELLQPGAEACRRLAQTGYAQPTLFALQLALAWLWLSLGVEPAYVLGHLLGQ